MEWFRACGCALVPADASGAGGGTKPGGTNDANEGKKKKKHKGGDEGEGGGQQDARRLAIDTKASKLLAPARPQRRDD